MANFYLDVSAIGNEYQAYADVPTWGAGATDRPLPMDGSGLAGPGSSPVVPIMEIQLTAQPADTNTLSIGGAVITAKNTVAAKNQFAIGASIAATVTNIVALLNTYGTGNNQCDAATTASFCQFTLPLPYWQYARVKPGTTDTVQIALRIATAELNGVTTLASSGWSTPPTLTQPSGGANGPFAYWWNTSSIFGKTATSYPGYGIACQKPSGVTDVTTSDIVYVRTKRSAANLTSGEFNYTSGLINMTWVGRVYIFDDGTTWTNDDGQFLIPVYCASGAGGSSITAGNGLALIAKKKYGVKFTMNGNNTLGSSVSFKDPNILGSTFEIVNMFFEELAGGGIAFSPASNGNKWLRVGCRFDFRISRQLGSNNSNGQYYSHRLIDCDINYIAAMATPTGIWNFAYNTTNYQDVLIEFINCRFNFVSNGPITQPLTGTYIPSTTKVVFENCIGIRPETLPITSSMIGLNRSLIFVGCRDTSAANSGRSVMTDNGSVQISFMDNGSQPYLTSKTPLNSNFSLKALIKTGMPNYIAQQLLTLNELYRGTTGSKTLTLEILVPTGVTFNKSQLGLLLTFTDSTGGIVHASTFEGYDKIITGTTNAISSSTASWNNATGYTAKKLVFDTSTISKQLLTNSEVSIKLLYYGDTPGSADTSIIINPEISIT